MVNYEYEESGVYKDISTLMLLRIEAGYHLDTIGHNCNLVTRFSGAEKLYSKKKAKANAYWLKGIKTFWNWLKLVQDSSKAEQTPGPQGSSWAIEDRNQDSEKPNPMEFLSDGIAGFVHSAIKKKKAETGLEEEQVCALLDQDQEENYGFHTYTSQTRS